MLRDDFKYVVHKLFVVRKKISKSMVQGSMLISILIWFVKSKARFKSTRMPASGHPPNQNTYGTVQSEVSAQDGRPPLISSHESHAQLARLVGPRARLNLVETFRATRTAATGIKRFAIELFRFIMIYNIYPNKSYENHWTLGGCPSTARVALKTIYARVNALLSAPRYPRGSETSQIPALIWNAFSYSK